MKQNLITSMRKIHERTNKGGLVKCLILFCHENFMFQKVKQKKKDYRRRSFIHHQAVDSYGATAECHH